MMTLIEQGFRPATATDPIAVGMLAVNLLDEVDLDEDGGVRLTPPGRVWEIVGHNPCSADYTEEQLTSRIRKAPEQ